MVIFGQTWPYISCSFHFYSQETGHRRVFVFAAVLPPSVWPTVAERLQVAVK